MGLDEIWDRILEEGEYIISFEWLSDTWEFISGLFENISEFSPIGLIYGTIMVGLVYFFRNSIFVFVDSLGNAGKIFWYPLFYIFAFGVGYVMGKRIWE